MPKTRQQTTPQQAPTRAAKRPRDETDAPAIPASCSKRPTVARRHSAAETGTSKQKVLAEQAAEAPQAVPAGVNDKENTPSGSGPRRSSRARTARTVQEVPPGPGLTRSARKQASSIGRGPSSSTPRKGRQTSVGKQSAGAKQEQVEAATAEFASHSHRGTDSGMTFQQPSASALKPPLQELPTQLVPIQTPEDGLPPVSSSSSQEHPSANQQPPPPPCQSPKHPVSLPPPCIHPSEPGLPSIPPQQPHSPFQQGSPAAAAVAAPSPAPASAPSSAAADPMLMTDPDPVGNHSSQEGSRHSSGQSNDHPTAVMARKHLNWDSTGPPSGPSSGPTSAVTKPPLSKGAGTQAAQAGTSAPAAADGDETWWDPTDSHKVLTAVLHEEYLL